MAKFSVIFFVASLLLSLPSHAMVAYHPVFTVDESDPNTTIKNTQNEANKAYKKGNYKRSYEKLEAVHQIYLKSGSNLQIAASSYQLATILQDLGDSQKAKVYFRASLKYLETELKPGNKFYLGRLAVMGNIYMREEQFNKAKESEKKLVILTLH